MTIEFHTPHLQVNDDLIRSTRNQLMKLSHAHKNISRAEIVFKKDETIAASENRVCEIKLTIFADDLLVRARTASFEDSAKEVLRELKKLVKKQVKNLQEPPDQMTSTVNV